MSSILVHVFFHGLIAVAPVNQDGTAVVPIAQSPNHMVALAVDGRSIPRANCLDRHEPRIVIANADQNDCTNARAAGCDYNKQDHQTCTCRLALHDVALLPERTQPAHPLHGKPSVDLPTESTSAGDFAYVANLSRLGLALDPKNLGPKPSKVVARMRLPFETITSCSLSATGPDSDRKVHPFTLKSLDAKTTPNPVDGFHQAVAEVVEVNVPYDTALATQLAVRLQDFDGKNPHVIHFKPDHGSADITFSNARLPVGQDDACNNGVGYDFQFFYDLAIDPPAMAARPVPHVDLNQTTDASSVAQGDCTQHVKATVSRPVCAMAAFAP